MMMVRSLFALLCAAGVAAGQTVPPLDADHAAKMAKGLALFKAAVKPVLVERCLKCHGGKSVESEFDLSDRDSLLKGGLHGKAVEPGKSAASRLLKLVRHQQDPHMPKSGAKLPEDTVAQLAAWIDLGAPYDGPLTATKTTKIPWTAKIVADDAKDFWAFRPLKKSVPPTVKNPAWNGHDIDRFLLGAMEKQGLSPNPPASKVQLLRRAYFDLIGLPPTQAEVDQFLNDSSPDAWPRLIDRLLASPHYGERWGRHWLDLARFAESHGFEHDYDRPTAYHYRDFVIDAINRDLPFNTFVRWQIAGDEYEPDNHLAMKATGFLAAGVHSTQITKSEVEKHRYDELDDKLATLGTAMLGLTIGCARCHDHKYDPIPSRDYYRMLSTFTRTVRSEQDLAIDREGDRAAKAAFDKEQARLDAAVRDFEAKELPKRFAEWERGKDTGDQRRLGWETLDIHSLHGGDGVELKALPDGSILVTGKLADAAKYTIVGETPLERIAALRIEALPDPSLPKNGPGRAANGNFALSHVAVQAGPRQDKASPIQALALKNPRADFEQKGLPAPAITDSDMKSAWAIDPHTGKPHAAIVDVDAAPFPGGSRLNIVLSFDNNKQHSLGRFRISVAAPGDVGGFLEGPISAAAKAALQIPPEQRRPEQQAALLQWFAPRVAEWRTLDAARTAHLAKAPKPTTVKALVASEGLPAVRLHTQGDDFLKETYYLRRGDVDNKEGVASPGYLQVLMPNAEAQAKWLKPAPSGSRTPWTRRALAEWITDVDQGAGGLLARVIVNRLWQHHFGHGIVTTPSDFGVRGERPSHPELLDALALQLIDDGWSLKAMHKRMMLSAAYQQRSDADDARKTIDRENKYLWHFNARRLEAEVIRDSILAVSGELDRTLFGRGTLDENSKRRSIYFTVKRSRLVPMMVIFDAPDALNGLAERPTTTIAPQALHLMNNATMRRAAKGLASRLPKSEDPAAAIDAAYRSILSRPPTAEERNDGQEFLRLQAATYPAGTAHEQALADFCHVLLCLNEFVYVE
jgi:mono/diheme cytochrome c family protein